MRVYAYRNKVQLLDGRLRLLSRVTAEADEQAMSTAASTSGSAYLVHIYQKC